jgi:hypothetical protein
MISLLNSEPLSPRGPNLAMLTEWRKVDEWKLNGADGGLMA